MLRSSVENKGKKNIVLAGVYLVLLFLFGTIGFMMIDDYSFINALYMTVITVSTVGFREAQPLSDAGKLFTAILILGSLGILTYSISILSQHFFQRQMQFFLTGFYHRNKKKKMNNHVVVVGYGRNGDQIVKELIGSGSDVVVIDQDHNIVINNIGGPSRFIEGDATNDDVLIKADIKNAKALITSLPNDADNLYVVLTARSLNPGLKIISRASNDSSEKKLRMAGVDNVVMPERIGGTHMATLISKPDVVEFFEHLMLQDSNQAQLMEIICTELPEKFINKPIREIDIGRISGANIVGFKTAEGEVIINPTGDTKLVPNSKLFVLGNAVQIDKMKALFAWK